MGILTGGGDCPGLNALIRAVTRTAILKFGLEVIGIHDGFLGLLLNKTRHLSLEGVGGILDSGGTILGTSNRTNPFNFSDPSQKKDIPRDQSDRLLRNFEQLKLSGLLCAGGDGTLTCAARLSEKGLPIIGLPKTIDNDLAGTDFSIGFDTAVANATEAIDKIHSTAQSHHRIMVVETMGRYAGWLALFAGLASGGDVILIPEIPFHLDIIVKQVKQRIQAGRRFSIMVVAEGAKVQGGNQVVKRRVKDSPDPIRLGGIGSWLTEQIERKTGIESRVSVLGHLQRGGSPTAFDRNLATRLGVAGVTLAHQGKVGRMVALKGNRITSVPLASVAGKNRPIPIASPWIQTARDLGIGFGD
ncbi:MAG: 6-phosphofructokinase [Desulfobacca sp.]|nr:6-phosphofructokinase [Desulfobacca sp.]